ncbi:hypothetical protein ACZ90_00290 [Streptomyces albus subsp. albus]|nr:hypothetical protein ACZ90_00290 [Streptomyces albus subsp. albus]
MPTFNQLVAQVRQQMLGFSVSQESVSSLAVGMTAADTTFQADGETVTSLSRGLVEIEDELVLVKKWDQGSGTVTVMGGTAGRGAEGTTAASHSAGVLITSNPAFPRARVKEEINKAVRALYPHLVVFGTAEVTYNVTQIEYELPAEATDVWYVVARTVGPSRVSQPMPDWRFNPEARVADFPSGKSIQLFNPITPGQPVRIVYAKQPSALVASTDDFTVTGYADRIHDLVVYGAVKRLMPGLLGGRLQQQAVEATERAPLVGAREISQAVQLMASLYAERLEEERSLMFAEVPNYAMFQGS